MYASTFNLYFAGEDADFEPFLSLEISYGDHDHEYAYETSHCQISTDFQPIIIIPYTPLESLNWNS